MNKTLLTLLTLLLLSLTIIGCRKQEKPITVLDDAKTARIGVMVGSTGEQIVKKRFPQAKIKSFDDVMDAVAAMKSEQLEAIVTALPTAVQVAKVNKEFTILPEPLDNEDTAIALRKEDQPLLTALNRIISELKADGTLADMRKRWLKPDLGPYEELTLSPPPPAPRSGWGSAPPASRSPLWTRMAGSPAMTASWPA